MATRPLDGWSYNTLHRASVVGKRTLDRTCSRKVEWPKPKPPCRPVQEKEDPHVYTSLDEAFSTVLQFMSQTTTQCKRYYKSNPPTERQMVEQCHCNRFHTSWDTTEPSRKPIYYGAHRQTLSGSRGRCPAQISHTQQRHTGHVTGGETSQDIIL